MFKTLSYGALLLGPLTYVIVKYTETLNMISYCGIIMCLVMGVLGTSRGMSSISNYVSGICIETPRVGTKSLLGTAICEAGLIGTILHCIILFNKMRVMEPNYSNNWLVMCSGVIVGAAYLISNTAVGIICGAIGMVDAKNERMFFKVVIFEFLPASVGIIGLVAGIVLISKVPSQL